MFRDITIGQYLPGESIIHRLDPRVKIIASIIYIVALFIVNNWLGYVLAGLFTALLVLLSKVPLSFILRGLKPLWIILAITLVLHLFMNEGETLFRLGPLVATWEGLQRGIYMVLRLVFLIIGTSLLTLTTSPIELTDGIEQLLNPFRRVGLPAHELAMMMVIALRFIPTLIEETDKIMKAQMARGADFESGNLVQRAKSLIPLLVPLFVSAFRRADELAMAMEARCYRGGDNRTRMKQLRVMRRDFISLGVMGAFVAIAVWSRFF